MEHVSKICRQSWLGKNLDEAKMENTLTEIILAHFILNFSRHLSKHILNDIYM